MACEFDALADLEELQIEKPPDTPNTCLQIRLELQINSDLKAPDRFCTRNRTLPKTLFAAATIAA